MVQSKWVRLKVVSTDKSIRELSNTNITFLYFILLQFFAFWYIFNLFFILGFYDKFFLVPDYKIGLIAMDIVCKMLFLRDVTNNALNFGFVSTCANRQELVIVDFKIV